MATGARSLSDGCLLQPEQHFFFNVVVPISACDAGGSSTVMSGVHTVALLDFSHRLFVPSLFLVPKSSPSVRKHLSEMGLKKCLVNSVWDPHRATALKHCPEQLMWMRLCFKM